MVILLPVFLLFLAYLAGILIQKIIGATEGKIQETILIGSMFLFLAWEFLVLPAIKLLASFALVTRVYSIMLLTICTLSVLCCRKEMKMQWTVQKIWLPKAAFVVILLFLLEIGCFIFIMPDVGNDYTVEMVNTTLQSDLIYENHPFMGDTFVYGITFRGKLVSLPLFYAYLTAIFHCHATEVVYRMVPIWVLALSYISYGLWANLFFEKTKYSEWKTVFFYMGLTLLNLFGSFSKQSIFYYQLNRGFLGETIVFSVWIPYGIYLCCNLFGNKKYCSIIYLIMVVLTLLTLVDYEMGLIPFLLILVILSCIALGYRIRRWLRCRNS